MTVPIANPELGATERENVADVLDSGYIAAGEEVAAFESEFADYCATDHAVATANGTAALHTALEAVGVEGEAVVTTPFSFVATANTIRFAGGEPVFADIDPDTYNLDPHAVEAVLRERDDVAAIMPVHLYALPAAMDHFRELADTHDVALVEDAAQAHGATHRDEPVGSLGDVACFSFYPTKNMTTGEGGMVTTDDEALAARARQFINHGRDDSDPYAHASIGHNFRMTNLAAAIGRAQLDRLPGFVEQRRANADRLTEGLADSEVTTPTEPEGLCHAYHQYTVRTSDRDRLVDVLNDRDVGYGIYYPDCIHELGAYEEYTADTPVAERATEEVLSLPVHPNVGDHGIDTIIDAVTSAQVNRV